MLAAMCQASERSAEWREAAALLSGYRFSDPLHQVLFDVLVRTSPAAGETHVRRLQQQVVLAGFPSFDVAQFCSEALPDLNVLELAQSLQARSRQGG